MRISDWSSDVCSSDLLEGHRNLRGANVGRAAGLKPLLQDKRASGVALQRQKAGDACACRLRGYPAAARGARQRKEGRKSVVQGKSVSVRVALGGRRIIKTNNE